MSEQKPDFLPALVGSMSEGAAGNPTVAMIEAAFRHHSLHYRYINMEVPSPALANAVRGARAMGFKGFNCSLPHKVAVIPHLDGLGMIVNQGITSVDYWTAIRPKASVMRTAVEQALNLK